MRWNAKNGWAIALILCGGFLLLRAFGLHIGLLMGWLVPAAMVLLGYYGVKQGRSTIGWIVLTIGLIVLAAKFWGVVAFLLPVVLIWAGWRMLKTNARAY